MSPAGPVNKGRIAGVALLGIAAAALVVGIVMAVSGGPVNTTANGTPSGPAPSGSRSPGAPGSAPTRGGASGGGAAPTTGRVSGTPAPSRSHASGPTTTVVPAPPNDGRRASDGGRNRQAVHPVAEYKKTPVRVYNNSMIRDLASRAAAEFRADGYNVVKVGNYSEGIVPATTMYYRKGTPEKATAEALAEEFGARAEPRFPGIRDASPGVIVIVTKDFSGRQQK